MSTSIVHVLAVIGKGAEQVESACEELLGRRKERHPKEYGSDDWSEQDHKDIEKFCAALVRASRELPVLYYAQYLDSWSVGDMQFRLLEWPDGKRRQIGGSNFGVVFYPSRYSNEFLAQIKRWRRRRVYRNQAEDRWYLDHIREAIEDALWLDSSFLVVSISECIDASRQDEEIRESLDKPIDLTQSKSSPTNARNTVSRGTLRADL
jgi:hypothetical protein